MLDITERKLAEKPFLRQNEYLKLLNEMTHSILTTQNFQSMMDTLAKNITALLHADDCSITRWDPVKQQVFPITSTANLEHSFKRKIFPSGKNFTVSALDAGKIITAVDAQSSSYTSPDMVGPHFHVKSIIGIPLIFGKNRLGAVNCCL